MGTYKGIDLEVNLIILDMIGELRFNSDGEVDVLDIIPIAIEIGEFNNLYNNGHWNDNDRNDCYNKVYELI